jgi:transposase-like protein
LTRISENPMREYKYRRHDLDFRADALALVARGDRSIHAVAKDLGVAYATLRYWYDSDMARKKEKKKPLRTAADNPATETTEEKVARLERENAQLRRQVDDLEMDRAILKKAAGGFNRSLQQVDPFY